MLGAVDLLRERRGDQARLTASCWGPRTAGHRTGVRFFGGRDEPGGHRRQAVADWAPPAPLERTPDGPLPDVPR